MSKTGQLALAEHEYAMELLTDEWEAGTLSHDQARERLTKLGYSDHPENPRNLSEALDALEENT